MECTQGHLLNYHTHSIIQSKLCVSENASLFLKAMICDVYENAVFAHFKV